MGLATAEENILPCDYAADKAQAALETYMRNRSTLPSAMFVNSTISLEGIVRGLQLNGYYLDDIIFGCFDWDPLAAAFHPRLMMVRQNVIEMIDRVFKLIDTPPRDPQLLIEVQPEIMGV